ncbi:MAG: OsmC family protein [Azoarcus sp.]|nr:OsmC family protein [Azoarcus sp.]
MSVHQTTLEWQRAPHTADAQTYSRKHQATLNGGQTVNVSASVEYKGDPECADPEQLLLSALGSCHMLTFLAIADLQGYTVEHYRDTPTGHLEKNAQGKMAITRIELSPTVRFGGDKQPDAATLAKMHAGAHRNCFIANSINAAVTVTAS